MIVRPRHRREQSPSRCAGAWAAARAGVSAILAACVLLGCGCSLDDSKSPCEGALEPYSAPTLIGDLYDYCFGGVDRTGDTLSVFLYLDTVNLPSQNAHIRKLVLSSRPTDPIAGADRLEFFFTNSLADSVDPGLVDQTGWKVAVPIAEIGYCQTCMTNCGLVPIIHLNGDVGQARFVYDPSDTQGIFIRHVGHQERLAPEGERGRPSIDR